MNGQVRMTDKIFEFKENKIMAKKTRAERNLKFETLQLHVGQEEPDPVVHNRLELPQDLWTTIHAGMHDVTINNGNGIFANLQTQYLSLIHI